MSLTQSITSELILEQHERVLLIKLNPDRLNAISRDMLDELSAKVVAADKDPEIRCMVLTGEGKGFCAGLDLVDTNKRREDEGEGTDSNQPPSRKLFDLRDAPINVMWHCDTHYLCSQRCSGGLRYGSNAAVADAHNVPAARWPRLPHDEMWCQRAAAPGYYLAWLAGQNP